MPPPACPSVLVTGCSTGIGLASARALKARGWRVLATARKPADIARLESAEGLEVIPLELADPASVAACASAVLERTEGRIEALFNNAAYGMIGAMEDIPGAALRELLEINVVAPHELARRLLPAMRAAGRGRILNCSSVLGFVSGPYRGAYCASKFALEALTDALRLEVAAAGIHVSLIQPGPIATEFMPTAVATFKRLIDVERSPHAAYYRRRLVEMETGTGDGALFRMLPEAVAGKVVRALEAPRPRSRYKVTLPTYGAALMRRLLPRRLLDAVVARF